MYRTDRIADNLRLMFSNTDRDTWQNNNIATLGSFSHYVDIDIGTPTFEVPLFLMSYFVKHLASISMSPNTHLVSPLQKNDKTSIYKSIPTALSKDIFQAQYYNHRLYKVKVPNSNNIYYGTQGALFTKDLKPIFMGSWKVSGKYGLTSDGNTVYKYFLLKPILRIAPKVYLDKEDSVQSFLCNKLLKTFLECDVDIPSYYFRPYMDAYDRYYKVQVILEDIPLKITSVPLPTQSTTQQELKDTVLEHIKDLDYLL